MTFVGDLNNLRGGLRQGFDALGAQQFVHRATILHHERLLQVWLERAICRTLGERAIMTEGG